MDQRNLDELLDLQAGVVSRHQVVAAGFDDNAIERLLRRRVWARVHRGIYVNHTGPLSWEQRAWSAVLFYWPAALSHDSAVYPGRDAMIHVAVKHPRRPERLPGIRLHRLTRFSDRVRWNLGPPRMRLEEAVLDMCAASGRRFEALATATDVCQVRRTTPERLLSALAGRQRMRHGKWLRAALTDVAAGVMSVLEHAYLNRVERAHGLPRGRRQKPARGEDGAVFRDVEYEQVGLIVELDGRLGHEGTRDRAKDMDRDLDAAVDGRGSVRVGWAQAVDRPCRTAGKIARLLQARGWTGQPHPCSTSCSLSGDVPAPHAGNPPAKRVS